MKANRLRTPLKPERGIALLPGLAAGILACGMPAARAANIAPEGTGIFGFNNAIDADAGVAYVHTGQNVFSLIDNNFTSRVDNWKGDAGGDGGQNFSFCGVLWPAVRTDQVTVLKVTLATFGDGGWFGPVGSNPGAGGLLTAAHLTAPTVQVTTNGGTTWTTVASTSNYLTALTGHQIGTPAAGPTAKAATFTLTTAQTGIDGIRLIGINGGTADNGFLGVFELEIESINNDTDSDGMDDQWEMDNLLVVGTNDAALDADGDGLTNLREFQLQTLAQNPDTDGDGLNDGPEVNTLLTDPKNPDTDGEGLTDGAEVNTHLTNPRLRDTDADGLTDAQEVNTWLSNPLVADTDGDGFRDGVEVTLGSNPVLNTSVPENIAPSGTAIIGTSTQLSGGTQTPYSQQNTPGVINDANLTTRVDTFGRTDPFSYVGITWPAPLAVPVDRLELVLCTFVDGGWFGPNNVGPGAGGRLNPATHLQVPEVQITTNGTTWTTVPASTNYLGMLGGHQLPAAGAVPPKVRAVFQLATAQAALRGIRLMGREGGTASGGFLGVWELAVKNTSTAGQSNIARYGSALLGTITDPDPAVGIRTAYSQAGTPEAINDGNYATRDTTFSRPDGYAYAGILWPGLRTVPVDRLEVTFAVFGDGGWFGPTGVMPSTGILSALEGLEAPVVQVTVDGGTTWTDEPVSSTYLTALTGQPAAGPATTASVVFALNTPRAGIDGIRLLGPEGGSNGFIGVVEFAARETSAAPVTDLGLLASAILGTNDADDGDDGRRFAASGVPRNINDGAVTTRVDTFDGVAGTDPVSYTGLVWPAGRPVSLDSLTLTMATFTDGGWFGVPGTDPGPGGVLDAGLHLQAPTVQVLGAGGEWTNVSAVTSDYLTQFTGHGIGGGANPNPSSRSATFTFSPRLTSLTGIRLTGPAGGTASGGFIGVFDLAAAGAAAPPTTDTDGDGQSDAAEAIAGTNPNDPNSVLRILTVTRTGSSNVSLTWSSVPGRNYQVQTAENPSSIWSPAGGPIAAAPLPATTSSATLSLPVPVPPKLFYRVTVGP